MKRRFKIQILLIILLGSLAANAQEPDTILTIEEVEIIGKVEQKGGIVEFFGEIFDLQMLKRSFRSYSLRFNGNLRDAKNAFQDSTGIHVYIRPLLQNDAFWPNIFQKIAERFYVDKINPSLEYKIWFTPLDTVQFKSNIDPIAQSLDPNNPEDFEYMDDPIEMIAHYDTVRAHTIDTLINLFNNAVYDSLPGQDSSAWLVQFYPAPGQTYGYDQYSGEEKYAGLRSTYIPYTLGGQSRYLSYKSIERSQTDEVYAFCQDKDLDVKFKLVGVTGTVSKQTIPNSDTLKIVISGISNTGNYDIVAYFEEGEGDDIQEIEIGRLKIEVYENSIPHKIVQIVKVNNIDIHDIPDPSIIQTELNKIYGQAVESWQVQPNIMEIVADFADDGNPLFKSLANDNVQYTGDMLQAIDKLPSTNDNTYYLFIIDRAENAQVMGLMPFNQPYGFIFLETCGEQDHLIKTIAHELGHGAYGLVHEFYEYPSIPNDDPNLLTWHKTNISLRKYQWDLIQEPQCKVFQCADGAYSQAMVAQEIYTDSIVPASEGLYLSPAKRPIWLSNIISVNVLTRAKEGEAGIGEPMQTMAVYGFTTSAEEEYSVSIIDGYCSGYTNDKGDFINLSETKNHINNPFPIKLWSIETKSFTDVLKTDNLWFCKPTNWNLYKASGAIKPETHFNEVNCCSEYVDPNHECYSLYCQTYNNPDLPGHYYVHEGNFFFEIIRKNPCILKGMKNVGPIDVLAGRDWEFHEKYFKIVYWGGLGIAMAPLVVELAAEYAITLTTQQLIQKSVEFATGVIIDATIQIIILMIDGKSFDQAYEAIDWHQALISGTENLVRPKIAAAGISCIRDGLMEGGSLKDNLKAEDFAFDCIIGAIASLTAHEVSTRLGSKLKLLMNKIRNNKNKCKEVFEGFDLNTSESDNIIKQFSKSSLLDRIDNANLRYKFDLDFDEFDDALKNQFLNNPEFVDCWCILHKAGRNSLKEDPIVLSKVKKVLFNNKLENYLPIKTKKRNIFNKEELVEQIVLLQDDASSIVGKRMSSMSDLMDNLDNFLENFHGKTGATQFIKELSESPGKMAGGSFVLNALKKNINEIGEITSFEVTISSEADEIGDIIVDVISKKGSTTNIYNEFKNWKSIFENRQKSFTRQFTGYLTNKNVGEFRYFFKKGSKNNGFNSLTDLKTEVTYAFKSEKNIFEDLPDNKFESIFGFSKGMRDLDNLDIQTFIDNNFEQIFKLID